MKALILLFPIIHPVTIRICLFAVSALFLTGCAGTFREVRPQTMGAPPAQTPTTLVMGEMKITDNRVAKMEAEAFAHALRRGVNNWSLTNKVFQTIETAMPGSKPASGSLVLTGTVTEVEKGSQAMRFIVGMGAGQARLVGDFTLSDDTGKTLAAFKARRSYLGGVGIGGLDMLSTEEMFLRLGEVVAETTSKWLLGKKMD